MKKVIFSLLLIIVTVVSFRSLFAQSVNTIQVSGGDITNYNTNQVSSYSTLSGVVKSMYSKYTPIRVLLSVPQTSQQDIVHTKKKGILLLDGVMIDNIQSIGIKKDSSNTITVVYIDSKGNTVQKYNVKVAVLLTKNKKDYVTIESWNRTLSWDKTGIQKDNMFKGAIDIRNINNKLYFVNEVDFKDYMKGIAEVPEGDEQAKREALQVVAASYALYYIKSTTVSKFPGAHYNASDDPNVFQKYRGYNFTTRSPKWQQTNESMKGTVLTFNRQVLRAAFYSCTDGTGKTKTPADKGWNSGYFKETESVYQSVDDTNGVDLVRAKNNQCGHGVGLSGLGATNFSKKGYTYQQILNYYYKNIELVKGY